MKKIFLVVAIFLSLFSFSQERDEKKEAFLNDVYASELKDKNLILKKIDEYKQKFNVIQNDQYLDYLLMALTSNQLENNEIDDAIKNEDALFNKLMLVGHYNDYAWKATGETLESEPKNLENAERLSLRALEILNLKKAEIPDFSNTHAAFADTYALVLYKQNKYKEALAIQEEIYKSIEMGIDGKIRLACYINEVKGANESKMFIESELQKGFTSQALMDRLEKNYKELKLSDAKFKKLNTQAQAIIAKEKEKAIGRLDKDTPAPDFELTNLKGEKVKLSSLIGKVVVLDFWATWCGPCKASFPNMQKMVEKYANDKNIEFFFVDVWEKGEQKEVFDKVSQFITDKKYSFNVLLDYDNSVSKLYNIQGVPSKIVINKKGNLTSSNAFLSEDEVEMLIQENLK